MKTKKQYWLKYILYICLGQRKKSLQHKQKLDMLKNNTIIIPESARHNINIDIVGTNNTVVIKDCEQLRTTIRVFGSNNEIHIDKYTFGVVNVLVGQNHANFGPVHDCKVHIGQNNSFESAEIIIKNSNAELLIGDNCMFSTNITLYHTDSHPIFDIKTNKITNKVKTMSVGNHVWVGANVTILKNTAISDDCIIGWGSIVSGKFGTRHTVIAGNPAKIVKTGVTWDSNGSRGYVQNEKD